MDKIKTNSANEYHRMCVECIKNQNKAGVTMSCDKCDYNKKIKSRRNK